MNETNTPPPLPRMLGKVAPRFGTVFKMVSVFVLVLLLLIPLSMIKAVLLERLERRNETITSITSTWGAEQVIAGPILVVPYKVQTKVWKDQSLQGRIEKVETLETTTARSYFTPADLKITGTIDPSIRARGIYEAVVYSGTLAMSGSFKKPSFEEWKVKPEEVMWDDALVVFLITDLRGTKEALSMKLGEQSYSLMPGCRVPGFASGVYARLKGIVFDQDSMSFSMDLTMNGSKGISFAPVGTQNEVHLSSKWADPSFQGSFLPVERHISASGFDATWKVSYYGRSYPQQWSSMDGVVPFNQESMDASRFGVDLITVVDTYRYVERCIKYGVLIIVLVFTTFFLFEILAAVRIHPFQYTLVGVALCLFYLALLSLSEVIAFGKAYFVGAGAATLMISLYSGRVLKSMTRAALVALGLGGIYGFLYVILREQDYSLLFGSAGLFVAVAIVMYATRNIDWYARDEGRNEV